MAKAKKPAAKTAESQSDKMKAILEKVQNAKGAPHPDGGFGGKGGGLKGGQVKGGGGPRRTQGKGG